MINGEGVALADVRSVRRRSGQRALRRRTCPRSASAELLATGDVHAIPLRPGLAAVSVPSKTYSSLAAGRPIVAAIDPGTVVPKILDEAAPGSPCRPTTPIAFVAAVDELHERPRASPPDGASRAGRGWSRRLAGGRRRAPTRRSSTQLVAEGRT